MHELPEVELLPSWSIFVGWKVPDSKSQDRFDAGVNVERRGNHVWLRAGGGTHDPVIAIMCGNGFIDTAERAKADSRITVLDYDDTKFRGFFTSPFDQYAEHIGKPFTVVRQIRPLKLATDEEEGEDDMYEIRFEDGTTIEVFGHEVCILHYDKCKRCEDPAWAGPQPPKKG
jgi:hypothetical protein